MSETLLKYWEEILGGLAFVIAVVATWVTGGKAYHAALWFVVGVLAAVLVVRNNAGKILGWIKKEG